MIIYYLAAYYPDKYIDKSVCISPAYKFNKLFSEGFSLNENITVKNIVPYSGLGKFRVNKQKHEKENGVEFIFPADVKNYFSYAKYAIKEIKKDKKSDQVVIICDSVSVNYSVISLWMKIFYGLKAIAIVTDIPIYFGGNDSTTKMRIMGRVSLFLMRQYSAYILLTQQMNDVVNKKKRPYVIMEGVATTRDIVSKKTNTKKICMYAGALHEEYGIKTMVDAFYSLKNTEWEMHIYGEGPYKRNLIKRCKCCNNIKYMGIKSLDEIFEKECEADLLINPRPCDLEYAKYSFPSKIMEYMSSGTAVIMTKLPGVPNEYFNYVYSFESCTYEGIREGLKNIFNADKKTLREKGFLAREFVLAQKNNKHQAYRVLNELEIM